MLGNKSLIELAWGGGKNTWKTKDFETLRAAENCVIKCLEVLKEEILDLFIPCSCFSVPFIRESVTSTYRSFDCLIQSNSLTA